MSLEVRGFMAASLTSLLAAATLHVVAIAQGGTSWIAFLHATLLGWAAGIIVAVRYHTLPSLTGQALPNRWLLRAHLALFVLGGVLAVSGYVVGWPRATAWGIALQLAGALAFVGVSVWMLWPRARDGRPPPPEPLPGQNALDRLNMWSTMAATACLPAALALLLAVRLRWVSGSWYLAAVHTATLGFVVLMIIGVAYRTLPRWNMCPTCGARYALLQLVLYGFALAAMIAGLGCVRRTVFGAGALMMAGSLALFGWTIAPTIRGDAPHAIPGPKPGSDGEPS